MAAIVRIVVGGVMAVAFGWLFSIGQSEPVYAQGSMVCDYGPTKYRSCCRESYRAKPSLGASARARDIDACMNGAEPAQPAQQPQTQTNQPAGGPAPAAGPAPAGPGPAGPAAGPTTYGGPPVGGIRRIECGTGMCANGCAGDEMAIGAFCNIGLTPSMYNDGSIRCATQSTTEIPTVLICSKK